MKPARLLVPGFSQLRKWLVSYRHFGLRETDIFIASYPKSGNTWLRFILASLITGKEYTFDTISDIIPEVENHRSKGFRAEGNKRFIKTHEMWRPEYKKSVYLIRDGRDVSISYYFFQKSLGMYDGSFSHFLSLFLENRVDGYGGWRNHVESWLNQREKNPDSVLPVKYEELLENPFCLLRQIVQFLGIAADDDRIAQSIEKNRASHMHEKEQNAEILRQKMKEAAIPFVRKASSGQWKSFFSPDDLHLFEQKAGPFNRHLGY